METLADEDCDDLVDDETDSPEPAPDPDPEPDDPPEPVEGQTICPDALDDECDDPDVEPVPEDCLESAEGVSDTAGGESVPTAAGAGTGAATGAAEADAGAALPDTGAPPTGPALAVGLLLLGAGLALLRRDRRTRRLSAR